MTYNCFGSFFPSFVLSFASWFSVDPTSLAVALDNTLRTSAGTA
jgi:hypothetical protein